MSTEVPQPKAPKPIWQRWWVIAIVVVLGLAAVGNLLGDRDGGSAAPTTTAPVPAATPSSTKAEPQPGAECVKISKEVADHLAMAIDETAHASEVGAVKPDESWVVAVKVVGGKVIDGGRAIFETLNPDSPSLTSAVDGMANRFTEFPHSVYGVADDPAEAAVKCMAPIA